MNDIKEFMNQLGIHDKGNYINNTYVIDISDSNTYGKYYSILDRSDIIEEDTESSSINVDNSNIQFINDDYVLTLIADFENSLYKLTVKEN